MTEVKRHITKVELICVVIWCIWQVLDAILFGLGLIKDKNGVSLKGF